MNHKHSWTYVHSGVLIEMTDAQTAKMLRDAKRWGYKLDNISSKCDKTSSGLTHYAVAHYFFTLEKDGRVESFSLYRDSCQSYF